MVFRINRVERLVDTFSLHKLFMRSDVYYLSFVKYYNLFAILDSGQSMSDYDNGYIELSNNLVN